MSDYSNIHVPTIHKKHPKVNRDFPIPEKENLMLAFNHEKPLWMPNFEGATQSLPMEAFGEAPVGGKGFDIFGVEYHYSDEQASGTPIGNLFSEIGEWREKFKWPNLDEKDWDHILDGYDFQRNEELALYHQFPSGLFERLHACEGFEQALMDLILEPEECRAFFERVVDFKIELFEHITKRFDLDFVLYNDDWGTARAPFFSEELFQETILQPTIRLFRYFREKGMKTVFHNCGLIDAFIPYLVNDIKADALQIQLLNDVKHIVTEYGNNVTVEYRRPELFLMYDPETKPETARALAREIVDGYGAQVMPGAGVTVTANVLREEVYDAFDEEIFTYSLNKYKEI